MPGPIAIVNGNISALTTRQSLASLGKYFLVTNPTIGTPVVGATIVAWSATANGMFVVSNGNAAGGANIILDRMTLRLRSTAPATTLTQQWEAYNETGIVAGTTAVVTRTPVQVLTGAGTAQTTGATVQAFAAGAITIPAAVGTRRQVGSATLTTGIAVDGDTYELQFGADGVLGVKNGGAAARATDPAHIISSMDPIVIAPQTTTWLNMWWLTQTTNVPSWEYALSFYEL